MDLGRYYFSISISVINLALASVFFEIYWYRNVCKKGAGWKIDPPDRKELYPNMNVDSGKWNNVKSMLAKKNGEITLLWKCGENHRNTMIETIENPSYNNELCCAALLGFNDVTRNTIDNIIEVNRNNSTQILPNKLETPEIEAQGKLSDYFGGSGTQSVLQLVFEGEDVLTVEGYEAYLSAVEVIEKSEIYKYLVNDPNQGLVQGFFAPIDVARAFNPALDVSSLTNEQFKQSNLHSLKCNKYYLTLFQNKTYMEV